MSTDARRASIPPRPAQPPTAGPGGAGSGSSQQSQSPSRSSEEAGRESVTPGARVTDDTEWQAFGERARRGAVAPGRPVFGGFDWQGSGETGAPDRRESGTAGDPASVSPSGERASVPNPAGRPPIRTPDEAGAGSEARGGSDGRGPGTDGSRGTAASTGREGFDTALRTAGTGNAPVNPGTRTPQEAPANASGDPATGTVPSPSTGTGPGARAVSGSQGTYRHGSSQPGFSDGPLPPPPASARFPDAPPAPGSGSGQPAHHSTPGTEPRSRRAGAAHPGPMPPESGTGPSASGAVPPRPSSRPSVPPRRPGAPTETASETTFRMRPVPTGRESGEGRTGSASASSGARPASAGPAIPPMPDTRPDATQPRPTPSRPAGAPARPGFPPRPTRDASATGAVRGTSAAGNPPASPRASTVPPPPAAPPSPAPMPSAPTEAPSGSGSRTAPLSPDPALSWSASLPPQAGTSGGGRPVVSFGEPEVGFKERTWGVRIPARIAAVAGSVVLGLGLIGGAVTGSWLIGDSGEDGGNDRFAQAGRLWHSVPVDQLFPPTVDGQGAGPGGADRTWTRIAVAPDSGCTDAFDPLLRKALAPVGCERLLRATYTDATQSYVTTVGLLFTDADAPAMRELDARFTKEGLDTRTDLMPLPYAAKNTLAADFGARQRGSWTISVLTDAPVVAYAVSGWADGRAVDTPEPAEKAMEPGDTSPAAQAGLGNEAQGLADRVERALRKTVSSPPEQPS